MSKAARSVSQTSHLKEATSKEARHDATKSHPLMTRAAALAQAKKNARPLLIGAGIGAVAALSVVALRARQRPPTLALFASPNSTFVSMLVKTAVFVIGRTVAKRSLAHVAARAVGQAVT